MKQLLDRFTRSTLIIVGVWMAAAAALSVAAVILSFWTSHVSESRLRSTAEAVIQRSLDLSQQHRSTSDIANELADLGRRSGTSVTVFNDARQRIAGEDAGINPPLPMFEYHTVTRIVKDVSGPIPPPRGASLFASNPPMMGFAGGGIMGLGPIQFGDGVNNVWVRIPIGFALIRLTESSARFVEQYYIGAMVLLFGLGIVLARPLQRRLMRHDIEPLVSVESALRRLSDGDYSKISLVGHEGTSTILETYNAAADRLSSALKRQADTEANMRQFVAEAGHELRTPLTVLMGFIEVLQSGAIQEQALAQRILESAAIEGQRMRALILKLLLLARLDAANPERNELVDVGAIAQDVVTTFKALPGGDHIALTAESGAFVNATSAEIRELISNLFDNALKHAPGTATRASVCRVNGSVELSVTDRGPGMPPDLKQRAFDRFTRGDDRGSVPGSGLGLAIVKRIVDRTRGTIELDTAVGKGTSVVVRIPVAQVEEA